MTEPAKISALARYAGLWCALLSAAVGFGIGTALYTLITPILEASEGLVRELQGLSWNLVPGLTVLGAVVGLLLGLAWRRRAQGVSPRESPDA